MTYEPVAIIETGIIGVGQLAVVKSGYTTIIGYDLEHYKKFNNGTVYIQKEEN